MSSPTESSYSDIEKDSGIEKDGRSQLRERDENLIEAAEPPFTVQDDAEKTRSQIDDDDGASLSKVSTKPSVNNIRSVPNGGLKAWLQVLGVFFVFFNTWGIINAVSWDQAMY